MLYYVVISPAFVTVQVIHDDIPAVLSLSRMFRMISLLFCHCPGCSWWYPRFVVQEVEKRFPDGLPLLDPIEDMGIKEKGLQEVIKVRFIDLHGRDLWLLCAGSSFFFFTILKKILSSCLNCSCIKVGLHLQNIQVQLWKIMEWVCSFFERLWNGCALYLLLSFWQNC